MALPCLALPCLAQVHDELVGEQGADPATDAYYEALERRVRQAYPERWGSLTGLQPQQHARQSFQRAANGRMGVPAGHVHKGYAPQPYIGAGEGKGEGGRGGGGDG